jgi:MFS family permease
LDHCQFLRLFRLRLFRQPERRDHPGLPARPGFFLYHRRDSILLGIYIGFLMATLVTGLLADVAGKKIVLLIAGICLTLGILGFSTFSTFWPLALSMLVLGLGLGAIELGANNIIVDLHTAQKAKYLNLMSVMHGLARWPPRCMPDSCWRRIFLAAGLPGRAGGGRNAGHLPVGKIPAEMETNKKAKNLLQEVGKGRFTGKWHLVLLPDRHLCCHRTRHRFVDCRIPANRQRAWRSV